jgi:hypothetical protein
MERVLVNGAAQVVEQIHGQPGTKQESIQAELASLFGALQDAAEQLQEVVDTAGVVDVDVRRSSRLVKLEVFCAMSSFERRLRQLYAAEEYDSTPA